MLRANRRRHITIGDECEVLRMLYPHDLQMYLCPPAGEFTFSELQKCCTERLIVLQLVDIIARRYRNAHAKDRKVHLMEKLNERGIDEYVKLMNSNGCRESTESVLKCRQRDHFSYYMLQVAFAKYRSKRKWLNHQEIRLFRWRLSSLNDEGIEQFLKINGFPDPISATEKAQVLVQLQNASPDVNVHTEPFYVVKYNTISTFVKNRMVYIRQGMAYVPQKLFIIVIVAYFRRSQRIGHKHITKSMAETYNDERLTNVFEGLCDCIQPREDMNENNGTVKIGSLNMLSTTSYPLCMRVLHEALRTNHHLRNYGRVQYTLFLKGIGVSWQDNLTFWEREFTQIMPIEEFNKEHRYHFRHLYGLEGRKADYQPFRCSQIIAADVGPTEYHGCPFRHLSNDTLKEKLEQYGFSPIAIQDISKLAEEHQYVEACKKYFQYTHDLNLETNITHPNTYFAESQKILSTKIFVSDDEEW